MSIVFKHITPEHHKQFTAVEEVVMTCADEATVEEMREAFDDFLSACGYNTHGYDDNKTLQEEFDAEAISDNITKRSLFSKPNYSPDLMSVFDEKM